MSLSLTLVPLAITVIMIAKQASEDITEKLSEAQRQKAPCELETKFTDINLLHKTLTEHGMMVTAVDSNTIKASCPESSLVFERPSSGQPFILKLISNEEINALQNELEELNEEYGLNVQTYTYEHVKENLEEGMTIESEEVLEDNSILLTINLN